MLTWYWEVGYDSVMWWYLEESRPKRDPMMGTGPLSLRSLGTSNDRSRVCLPRDMCSDDYCCRLLDNDADRTRAACRK